MKTFTEFLIEDWKEKYGASTEDLKINNLIALLKPLLNKNQYAKLYYNSLLTSKITLEQISNGLKTIISTEKDKKMVGDAKELIDLLVKNDNDVENYFNNYTLYYDNFYKRNLRIENSALETIKKYANMEITKTDSPCIVKPYSLLKSFLRQSPMFDLLKLVKDMAVSNEYMMYFELFAYDNQKFHYKVVPINIPLVYASYLAHKNAIKVLEHPPIQLGMENNRKTILEYKKVLTTAKDFIIKFENYFEKHGICDLSGRKVGERYYDDEGKAMFEPTKYTKKYTQLVK